MKKLLFSSLCAVVLLTACQSEDSVLGGGGNIISDGQARYLSVNVVSNTDVSRAVDADPADADNYEKGLDAENKVTKVRFYFFDSNGAPAYVKAGKAVNWYDWDEGVDSLATPGEDEPNVEKILKATIVISTKEGDLFPSQMLAVVNPRDSLTPNACTLEEIRTITADYATYANGGTADNTTLSGKYFPMCNAVYAEGDPLQRVTATKITADDYKTTANEAKTHPVQVFVERNVAKVRVSMELDPTTMTVTNNGLIKLQSKDNQGNVSDLVLPVTSLSDLSTPTTADKQVYLKLAGWNVTADMNVAYLSKRLTSPLWNDSDLGFIWNYPTFHRSYWAAQLATSNCRYGNFEAAKAKPFYTVSSTGLSSLADNTKGFTYCNENTIAQGNVNYLKKNTKIILAGTLCDENGKALTICEYYGVKFVDNDKLEYLKNSVLNYLTDNGNKNYYRRLSNNTIKSISAEDITFEYAKSPTPTDSKGLYYVIPVLTEKASDYTWYTDRDATSGSEIDSEDVDNTLRISQHAKIWNTGMTYYYADINHFGKDEVGGKEVARRGVVRNHIYDMSINTIYGLGTPVWNPDTNIIPEKTEDEDTYIGAQINILSWRIVNNNVNLQW